MTNIASLPDDFGTQLQFYISTNADFRTSFQFSLEATGAPIDITGIDFFAQLRQAQGGTDVLLNLSTLNGGLVSDPTTGTLTFAVPFAKPATGPKNHTSLLPPGGGVLDIVASADGVLKNLCEQSGPATVTIVKGITDTTLRSTS